MAAVDAAIEWIKKSIEPAVLDLATGAGKSFIIALIAQWLDKNTGKKTLVIAPSKELVQQDREKYLATGNPASIWCASIEKSLKHSVVFGTPQSIKNSLEKFGKQFACVIIDEGDCVTPTVKAIIEHIRKQNSLLRVLGLTATPYRTLTGYIYQYDNKGKKMHESNCIEPFYHSLLYRVDAHELIKRGFLTPPHADPTHVQGYDTADLELNSRGQFDAREVEQTFEGKGRLTSFIVADIVQKSYNRNGVLIFAATIAHAFEIMDSLPKESSEIIHGGTPKLEREIILERYSKRKFKYLVNVAVLTVGFDAPHVDVVAILRATESVRLLQQIIGRGLRLVDPSTAGDLRAIAESEKPDCLVLDYAENIERHCPDGDLFNPKIEAGKKLGPQETIEVECPECSYINDFVKRKNPDGLRMDKFGYFVDIEGNRIPTANGEMPSHMGRRCDGFSIIKGSGTSQRCTHRWGAKTCPECEHENDITARYCEKCKEELVDPNEKLKIEFTKIKKDPFTPTSDKVLSWKAREWVGGSGKVTLRIDWTTECRTFTVWYHNTSQWAANEWSLLNKACGVDTRTPAEFCKSMRKMPQTITAYKDGRNGFFKVKAYNEVIDCEVS